MKMRDFSTRPVWSEDAWLTKHAGETLGVSKDEAMEMDADGVEKGVETAPALVGTVCG